MRNGLPPSMEDRDGFIWMDGSLVPWRDARFHVLTHTLHHGLGVFEGVRAYKGKGGSAVFRLDDHTSRFFRSAHILQMQLPLSKGDLSDAQREVIKANGLDEAYIRPIAFYGGDRMGVAARGNSIHLAIIAWQWDAYMGEKAQSEGIRLKTSSFRRHDANTVTSKAKASGLYINSVLANQEARQADFDDALMLDHQGCVAEASTSNVFLVRDGQIETPGREAILEGITRDSIVVLARENGLRVVERNITRDDLYCADEVFTTGTAAEITPVVDVDGRLIADGKPGTTTRLLQSAYFRAVRGTDENDRRWLTPC